MALSQSLFERKEYGVAYGIAERFYNFCISTNESDQSTDGQFCDNVSSTYRKIKFLGRPVYESQSNKSSLIRELLNTNQPEREEEAYCNMYVFKSSEQAKRFQDGAASAELKYDIDWSIMGTQSCNGCIRAKGMKTIYLGFENEQLMEAIHKPGLDEAATMVEVNEKLAKVRFRLSHLATIDEKVAGLTLIDGQVAKADFDAMVATAAEIDQKESFVEDKLFAAHGKQCLMSIRRLDLEEKINKAASNGKISEIENIAIKQFASKYGFSEAELYTMVADGLKNS